MSLYFPTHTMLGYNFQKNSLLKKNAVLLEPKLFNLVSFGFEKVCQGQLQKSVCVGLFFLSPPHNL